MWYGYMGDEFQHGSDGGRSSSDADAESFHCDTRRHDASNAVTDVLRSDSRERLADASRERVSETDMATTFDGRARTPSESADAHGSVGDADNNRGPYHDQSVSAVPPDGEGIPEGRPEGYGYLGKAAIESNINDVSDHGARNGNEMVTATTMDPTTPSGQEEIAPYLQHDARGALVSCESTISPTPCATSTPVRARAR